jgi:hypothetical protein
VNLMGDGSVFLAGASCRWLQLAGLEILGVAKGVDYQTCNSAGGSEALV